MASIRTRLTTIFAVSLAATLPFAAGAKDLEDLISNLNTGLAVGEAFECGFGGLCEGLSVGASLTGLQETSSEIVNNRIVPLSSSVSGFTYEYNEDLDIYERSTRTFGPLFSERARTLGARRSLLGMSHSTFEFDEFEGESLSSLNASDVQGTMSLSGGQSGTLIQGLGTLDSIIDLDIDEDVTTFYYTFGVTDRLDVGVVLPIVRLDMSAQVDQTTTTGTPLQDCSYYRNNYSPADLVALGIEGTPCTTASASGSRKVSDDHLGPGDLVVRSKWNFMLAPVSGAALLAATVPTGDTDNLTGLHTMTFTPGVVFSRDFDTAIGGFGFEVGLGYWIRPDIGEKSEWEWSAGIAYQPFSRASFAVDFLGSDDAGNSEFGDQLRDLSIGAKFQLTSGLLLDLNVITPLNDQGLRSDGIYSAQIEWIFGD